MKQTGKIVFLFFMAIALVGMFLPVATFHENIFASIGADIDRQDEKVDSAETQLQHWIDDGKKSEDEIRKQQDLVQKEKDQLQALIEEQANVDTESVSGLGYSLLPGRLPEALEIDLSVVNQYKLYDWNDPVYYGCVWAAFGCLVLAAILVLLTGKQEVSRLYTFSAFLHLIGILLAGYALLRLAAFPIALPYGNATMNIPVVLMILGGSIIAFVLHVLCVRHSARSMIYVFCGMLSALAIVPFWIMIVNATRSNAQIQNGVSLIPGSFLGNNWNVLSTQGFNIATGFRNSAIIAFGSAILGVYFSAMTAYGFKVYRFRGNRFLYAVVLAIIMIPGQVTGTGFFLFMYQLGWVDNRLALIIPSIASAGTVFFFRQYLEANLQISLVEAARIDGSGELRTFNGIILPVMAPAMAIMGIMAVIESWNSYLPPLMLFTKPDLKTLPMMVQELRENLYRAEYGSVYLGLTLTALPLMIVYFVLSKFILEERRWGRFFSSHS